MNAFEIHRRPLENYPIPVERWNYYSCHNVLSSRFHEPKKNKVFIYSESSELVLQRNLGPRLHEEIVFLFSNYTTLIYEQHIGITDDIITNVIFPLGPITRKWYFVCLCLCVCEKDTVPVFFAPGEVKVKKRKKRQYRAKKWYKSPLTQSLLALVLFIVDSTLKPGDYISDYAANHPNKSKTFRPGYSHCFLARP